MSQDRIARLYSTSELKALDLLVRINALAQIAGTSARWTPDARGMMAATQHFLQQGVRLHPTWVDLQNDDITGTMQGMAVRKLKDPDAAASILNELLVGDTLRSHARGAVGHAADMVRDKVLGGGSTSKFKAHLLRHLGQRLTDKFRRKFHTPTEIGESLDAPDSRDPDSPVRQLPAEALLDANPDILASDPMVRRWIEDQIEDLPGPEYYKEIALAWLDDPERRGLQSDLARQYDVSASTVIKVIDRMTKFLSAQLQRDERQRKHWQALMLKSDIADLQGEFLGRYASESDAPRNVRVALMLDRLYRSAVIPNPARLAARFLKAGRPLSPDALKLLRYLSDRDGGSTSGWGSAVMELIDQGLITTPRAGFWTVTDKGVSALIQAR